MRNRQFRYLSRSAFCLFDEKRFHGRIGESGRFRRDGTEPKLRLMRLGFGPVRGGLSIEASVDRFGCRFARESKFGYFHHRHEDADNRPARPSPSEMRVPRSILGSRAHTQYIPSLRHNTHTIKLRWNSTASSSSHGKLPPQIPSTGYVDLSPLRGLLALHGPDAAKFLQGLITKIFPSETEPDGMFTSFLSPQVWNRKLPLSFRGVSFLIHSSIQAFLLL
jgi:hypothetical protein